MDLLETYEHPAWLTAGSTFVAYGLLLVAMFLVLFVLPFAVYTLL